MATSKESQPGGDILSVSRARVFRLETQSWLDTGGISRIHLLRTQYVYQIDGQLESTGQATIKATLGQNSEFSSIDEDPNCYRLTISPHEVYAFRTVADQENKTFCYVLQNVLRILKEPKTRPEEPPSSPREAWLEQAAPRSPRLMTEQLLNTSSDPGNRNPTLVHPSSRHLVNPLRTEKTLSSSTSSLGDKRTAQDLGTVNTSAHRPAYSLDQRFTSTMAVKRSDFEVQVESLCEELAHVIGVGDVEAAVEIVRSMAQERIPLSIKMKNPKVVPVEQAKETIDLKVVVEDREASGGVFVMKVLPTTRIQQLQEEVAERFGFPPKVQKWIIGKMMARPTQMLADCHIKKAGHTAFLYLISGKSAGLTRGEFENYVQRNEEGRISARGQEISDVVRTDLTSPMPVTTQLSRATSIPALNTMAAAPTVARTEVFPAHIQTRPVNEGQGLDGRDQRIQVASNIATIEQALQREGVMMPVIEGNALNDRHSIPVEDSEEVQPVGWKCNACTYVNTPTRPGCEMCGGDRPEGYVVPENTTIREQERQRMAEEQRQQELFEQALQKQEQEQAIARERNFQQLVETAQQSLIQNREEFDCVICYTSVLPGEGVVLRECLHSFCRDCLKEHIRNCTDPEIQCPFQDDEFACHSLITAQEIKSLLSPEDFNKYLNRSLATAESQAANSFHCKTPNCPGWCIYEDNSNIFHCPVCGKQNCLTCKAQHFPDMNCKEYQDDLKRRAQNDKAAQQTQKFLESMITKGEAMKCPQCEIILLKKDGCDWMRCSMCRLEICWATRGPRWGPQGVGDISGGCKCRVEGKKCHPKCQNCH